MDEARRFLRLVTPGLVFAVEVVILLWVLRPHIVTPMFDEFKNDSGISFLFAGLLASGGLGFIFSAIHHNWYGRRWSGLLKATTMDHSEVIKRLIKAKILDVCDVSEGQISRENAWIIMNAIWHQRVKTNDKIKGAKDRMTALVDLVHSLGTARVASILAPMFVLIILVNHGVFPSDQDKFVNYIWLHCGVSPVNWNQLIRCIFAVAITFGMCLTFHIGYRRAARVAKAMADQVLSDAMILEKSKNDDKPIETWPLLPD